MPIPCLRTRPFVFHAFAGALAGMLLNVSTQAAPVQANLVLGQASFTTRNPSAGPAPNLPFTTASLNGPGGVAVSPTSGKLFVADYFNSRVTRYANAAALASGAAAEDFVPLPSGGSWSVYVDALDSLWIADAIAGRIYRYGGASTATLSLNFANLTLAAAGCEYLTVDATGTLWVTYGLNSPTVTWLANATTAPSIYNTLTTPTWTGTLKFTNKPELGGVAVTAAGRKVTLWVADAKNNKVYRFDKPKTGQSEKNAAAVLGQPTVSSKGPKTGSTGLSYPRSLFLDAKGRLWVSDTANDQGAKNANRALRWDKAATLSTGAKASAIIGQSSFTSNRTGTSSRLIAPFRGGICTDLTGALWFADDFNNRVLRFTRIPKTK